MSEFLAPNIDVLALSTGVVAGTDGAFVTSLTEIDMRGFDHLAVVFVLGTVTASGVITVRIKNTDSSGTYGAGTIDRIMQATNSAAGAGSNKCVVLDVRQPTIGPAGVPRRWCRVEYQRTAANVVIAAVLAIRYNGDRLPVNLPGSVVNDIDALATSNCPAPSTT
jgi:hypothetical protein